MELPQQLLGLFKWLNENAPAVQAVGTLLAVATAIVAAFIAIYVPFKINQNETRRQEHDRFLKSQAIAILVEPLLYDLDMQVEAGSMPLTAEPRLIEIPEALKSLTRDLWLMGHAGGHVLQLIGHVQVHNRILWELPTLPIDMLDDEQAVYTRNFNERITLMRECVKEASAAISLLLEPKK